MLGWAPSVFALMLVSCSTQPGTPTTRQTTTTTNAAENRMSQPIGYRDVPQGLAAESRF
jgi:hypothetical protein